MLSLHPLLVTLKVLAHLLLTLLLPFSVSVSMHDGAAAVGGGVGQLRPDGLRLKVVPLFLTARVVL